MIPPLDELKTVHGTLMRAYLGAAIQASFLSPAFVTKRWWNRNRAPHYKEKSYLRNHLDNKTLVKPPMLAIGFVAQAYVEAHIRRRLEQLGAAYTQLEQALDLSADNDYHAWLSKARESMALFAATLGRFHRLRIGLGAFWATATALVTALGFEISVGQWVDTTLALVVLSVIISFVPYLYLILRSSFLVKRDLFLPGTRVIEKQEEGGDQRAVHDHVYEAEAKIFELLYRAKPKEAAVDIIGSSAVLGIAIAAAILGLALLLNLGDDPIAGLASVGLVGVIIYYVLRIHRRVWR